MPYFKIKTLEYVPMTGFYWAIDGKSQEEVIDKIQNGQIAPTNLFGREGNHIEIEVLEIEDVTERVEQIIKDNALCESEKKGV